MPSPAAERRFAFIGSLFEGAPQPLTEQAAAEIIERVLAEARPLGRTQRWQSAIDWFEVESYIAPPGHLTWVATQGSIGLGWAAE